MDWIARSEDIKHCLLTASTVCVFLCLVSAQFLMVCESRRWHISWTLMRLGC